MNLRVTLIAAIAFSAVAGSACAGEGWYVGLGAGWQKPNDFAFSGLGASGVATPDAGWIAAGALGMKYGNWRIEIEGTGSHTKFVGSFTGGVIWTSGGANLLYDIPLLPQVNAYVGGGVGAGQLNREAYSPLASAGQFGQWGFQWQAIGGFSYETSPNIDLFAEYRYRHLKANDTQLFGPGGGPIFGNSERENVAMVGVRYYPWAEVAPPPPPPLPPPPPPPPPAPPPPAVKTFIVFFDFNKSNLTAEAQQVVAQAVQTVKQTGAVRVLVTGHTDTVGSDSYNMGLSVRRAETVKDEMVREGVEGSEISIEGKSFHDPLVPTGPGVREPQNRRAVIDLGSGSP